MELAGNCSQPALVLWMDDRICALARATGHKFSAARLKLANIAWLLQRTGYRPIDRIVPPGEMPEETHAILERLLAALK